MKKILALLLVVVICCSFAACFDYDTPEKEIGETQSTETKTKKEETFGLNESAVFTDLKFTATELKESGGSEFLGPDEGNVYVGVKFTIENISDEDQTISSIMLFDGYADDVKCAYSIGGLVAFDGGQLDGTVASGKKMTGWYVLEVPKKWNEIELQVKSNWLSGSSAKFVFEK